MFNNIDQNKIFEFKELLYIMKIYHKTSIARAQANRLFNIIQQCSQHPTENIEKQSLGYFLKFQEMNSEKDLLSVLHSLDKQGKQMNKNYWSECISISLADIDVRTQEDIRNIHNYIKQLMIGAYCRPMLRFEQWDENRMLSQNDKGDKFIKIMQLERQLSLYMNNLDANTLKNVLDKVNYCLSIITLGSSFRQETISIFQMVLKGNFMEILMYCLSINIDSEQTLVNILKCLCYLYTSLKYQKIRKILSPSFLCQIETLKGLLQNISDQRVQIKYYTFVLINLASHHLSQFSDFIIKNQQCLTCITQNIQSLSNINNGLVYGLQILVNVIQAFIRGNQQWQNSNLSIIQSIFMYGMSLLQNQNINQRDTQIACLRLLSICVKTNNLSSENIQNLTIINNIFQIHNDISQNENIMPLVAGALDIIRNLLLFNNSERKPGNFEPIISDKKFEAYFRRAISAERQKWCQHANILHIAHILSTPQYSKYLFERELIQPIFELAKSPNGCTKLILSEIIINLMKNSVSNEWFIAYMYEKNILEYVGILIRQSFREDEILTQFYGKNNKIFYTHKQVFINCIKILYLLTDDSSVETNFSFLKKCQFYKKSFTGSFIENFTQAIQEFFRCSSSKLLIFNLNQKHEILQDRYKFKLFKLISHVIEQMTINLRKRYVSNAILKKVHFMRKSVLENLYSLIPLNQLQAEGIPIYIKINVIVDQEPLKPEWIYRLTWNHFQYYLSQLIKKMVSYEPENFKIQNLQEKIVIKSQYEYRRVLQRILIDYSIYKFNLDIRVFDIQKREDVDLRPHSINMNGSPSRRINMIDNPRSVRIPVHRDVSPYASQRINTGTYGLYRQSSSPNFGIPCRNCEKITKNRNRICDECSRYKNRFN